MDWIYHARSTHTHDEFPGNNQHNAPHRRFVPKPQAPTPPNPSPDGCESLFAMVWTKSQNLRFRVFLSYSPRGLPISLSREELFLCVGVSDRQLCRVPWPNGISMPHPCPNYSNDDEYVTGGVEEPPSTEPRALSNWKAISRLAFAFIASGVALGVLFLGFLKVR
jgi:hypothetical protein